MDKETLISLTADIVAAHVANNTVSVGEIGNLLAQVHKALEGLGTHVSEEQQKVPAVSVRASVKPDYLVCMECGRKQKTLKRHLRVAHGMTPEDYRSDYGLSYDYPLAAPNYSKRRSEMAHAIGLGQRGRKRSEAGNKSGEEQSSGGVVDAVKSVARAAAKAVTGSDTAIAKKRRRKTAKDDPQTGS